MSEFSGLQIEDFQGNIQEAESKIFPLEVGPKNSKNIGYFSTKAVKIGVDKSGTNIYEYRLQQYNNAKGDSATLKDSFNIDGNTVKSAKFTNEATIGRINKKGELEFGIIDFDGNFKANPPVGAIKNGNNISFSKKDLERAIKNSKKNLPITEKFIVDPLGDELLSTVNRESLRKGTRQSYENLVYPTTLRRSDNDRLKISVLPPLESESERKGNKGKAIGSVTLPPPGKITDNNKVDFKSGTLNPLELALAEAGLGLLLDDNPEALQNATKQFLDGTNDLKTVVSGLFVGKAINKSADAILSREAGAIINPNMQLLFNGPTLRPFNFNYKMSPRDRGESVQVQKIIRMFKQSSAVQRTDTNFFLRSPNRYRLEFKTRGDSDHRFLPKIKTCSLLGFGVDYTPENSYMSYENSSMVSYNLTFAFQEIEPVFNDQYSQFDDLDIGF